MDARQFTDYCGRLDLTEQGRLYLERVRSSPPSRRVASRVGNVVVRFPSRKMGFVIQVESRHYELAAVYQLEHDIGVTEYYDQPEPIKIAYAAPSGRMTGGMYTPDFLVLREESVAWVEVKPEERLIRLAETQPNRYRRDAQGIWRCPPAEGVAAQFHFSYRIITSTEINKTLVRNLEYLDDYFRGGRDVPPRVREELLEMIKQQPGLSIATVRGRFGPEAIEPLLSLIVLEEVFFDLEHQLLTNQETASLYLNREMAVALKLAEGANCCGVDHLVATCGNSSDGGVPQLASSLKENDQVPPSSVAGTANDSIRQQAGSILPLDIKKFLQASAPEDLALANQRVGLIRSAELAKDQKVPKRTLRRWKARFRKAEKLYGNGYIGLLPHYSRQGNKTPRLAPHPMGAVRFLSLWCAQG